MFLTFSAKLFFNNPTFGGSRVLFVVKHLLDEEVYAGKPAESAFKMRLTESRQLEQWVIVSSTSPFICSLSGKYSHSNQTCIHRLHFKLFYFLFFIVGYRSKNTNNKIIRTIERAQKRQQTNIWQTSETKFQSRVFWTTSIKPNRWVKYFA